jgi:hypothetical protein
VNAPILASKLFGTRVVIDGAHERLRDLGVVREGDSWRVVAVRTHSRDAALTAWRDGHLTATATGADISGATWLREALFDRQIVDLDGRRVIRVGDVVLRDGGDRLEVAAVEVGAAAVYRRLGFAWLAARLDPQLLAIDRLHLAGAAAGGLLLDASRERLEKLDSATVTSLLARLPVPVAEKAVATSRHRDAVRAHIRRRRRRRRFRRAPR